MGGPFSQFASAAATIDRTFVITCFLAYGHELNRTWVLAMLMEDTIDWVTHR